MARITTNQERLFKDRNVFGASLMNAMVDSINSFYRGSSTPAEQVVSSLSCNRTLSVGAGATLRGTASVAATATLSANVIIADGKTIQAGQTNGLKIGTVNTCKLGFYGVAVVAKPSLVTAIVNNTTQSLRQAVQGIRTRLVNLGLMSNTA